MIPLTLGEVAAATGGELTDAADPQAVVSGPVVVDSRLAVPGALFVALAGERVDGHDFAAAALESGAVAVLAERPVGGPAVVCPDGVAALGALAAAVLSRLPDLLVVGVTGSAGKTGTKDLLAQVLGRWGDTVAPQGSYNNEIGVPLTALRAQASTRYLVLELGARGAGHIGYLCRIAPPRIGVVLNVGAAHASEFGTVEATATAKGELVEALPPGGLAVLNADDDLVRSMAARTRAAVVLVGQSALARVRAEDVTLDSQARPRFQLVVDAGSTQGSTSPARAEVLLRLHGEHHVSNALAVAAVALHVGMELPEVARALSEVTAQSRWRMEVTQRPDGVTVVNDAYNANPESVRAALKALVVMAPGRRSWAVLGEMLELGADSVRRHDELGRLAVRLNVSRLVAVGEGARAIHSGAVQEGSWGEESTFVPDADAAFELLTRELADGDVVLVKSSRDVGLRWLGDRLAGRDVPTA